jgi:O-antigen/teichoic acid export membrane protein
MGVMNVATYGFTMIAARLLGPRPYGALASLMATLLVFGVLQLALQATAARRIAADRTHLPQVRHTVLRVTFGCAIVLGLLLLALTPVVDRLLRLDDAAAAALVGVTLVPMTLVGGQLGILQGERRWAALSWVYAANGVPRLLLGTALVLLSPTTFAAMLGVALASFVPVVVAWLFLRHDAPGEPAPAGHGSRSVVTELVHNAQALLAFFALSNVDVLIARNQLSAHEAGLYAGGVILVKAVLFLPQFVVVLAFPSLSTVGERRRALVLGLGLVTAAGVLCTVGAWLLSDVALIFVGGHEYAGIRAELWLFAVLGTLLAMLQLLVYSVLAQQARRTALLVWLALVGVVALGLTAESWQTLLLRVVLVDLALCAVLLAVSIWRVTRGAGAAESQ